MGIHRVEIIERDMHPVEPAADDLARDLAGLVVEQHHVIGIPADGPRGGRPLDVMKPVYNFKASDDESVWKKKVEPADTAKG